MEQLEPSARESIVKLLVVLKESAADLVVFLVTITKSDVSRQHRWLVLLVGVVGIGDDILQNADGQPYSLAVETTV